MDKGFIYKVIEEFGVMEWYVLLFYSILLLYLYIKRKDFEWIGIVFGKRIKEIDWLERFVRRNERKVRILSYIFVILMLLFSIYSMYLMVSYLGEIIKKKIKKPGVTIIVPGFKAPGTEIKVPLVEGLITVFILAFFHEISHAIIAIYRKIKVKSVGYGFLLFLPIAFTEIENEEELVKRPKDAIFVSSAGPSANLIISLTFFLLFLLVNIVISKLVINKGVLIVGVEEYTKRFGLRDGMIIHKINGTEINSITSLGNFMKNVTPGSVLNISTDKGNFLVETRNISGRAYIGIKVKNYTVPKKELYKYFLPLFYFLSSLFYWIYFLNFAVGLVNAYPFPFLDGALFWGSVFKILLKDKKIYNYLMTSFIILWMGIFIMVIFLPLII